LHQITNLGGGCRSVLGGGHVTKRELYEKLYAYIAGLQDQLDRLTPTMVELAA